MVGIVLVSHSRPLAMAVEKLVRSMTGPALPLALAAGAGDDHVELGTDAVEISEAILSVKGPEGVLVLMDMGSAILSSETALDLMEEKDRENVRFCSAPFVEGAVAAGVTANLGSSLEEVCAEALASLQQKERALQNENAAPSSTDSQAIQKDAPKETSRPLTVKLTIQNPHGLHARPAARLIGETKLFQSEVTVRNLSNGRGPVSAKSLSSLASLEILQGHQIEVAASGADAEAALERIGELVRSGLGETLASNMPLPARSAAPKTRSSRPVPISGGLAIGPGFYCKADAYDVSQEKIEDVASECSRLKKAVAAVQRALEVRRTETATKLGANEAGIYEAQILALEDPELIEQALHGIANDRKNAALAWSEASKQVMNRYANLEDPYLRERAADIKDVGDQVLAKLAAKSAAKAVVSEPSILIAEDLTPTQASELPRDMILGVVLLDGGPTAHSSILLKAFGIPALVQARSAFAGCDLDHPEMMAFDGTTGELWLQPDPTLVEELRNRRQAQQSQRRIDKEASLQPGATLDGHRVQVFANVGSEIEAGTAAPSGAEGVGLLRTEFLFLDRERAPSEAEQIQTLREIARQMEGRPVIVRTLDIGGDKAVPYLQMAPENNPFLGVRALRLCFSREEIFTTQLRAILQAGQGHDFRIMFPMVADVGDLTRARACLEKTHRDLETEKIAHLWPVQTGIMIEIPSAALQADALAEHADFFSIGTNDLTQYTLAADRGNPELAAYQDTLHPAVLRLVHSVVRAAKKRNRLVAVCGEAASDDVAALIFVGLGVEELSMATAKIPRIKALLRGQKLGTLQQLAEHALSCQSPAEVRDFAGRQLSGIAH
jgi:phosphoenolpyruvate-protein phosphotransferase/dihydroxyacetone kinase phosphotransfer subunit